MHTYKLSRKLQNIYHQEGIIYVTRQRTRLNPEHRQLFLFSFFSALLLWQEIKNHTSVPRKANIFCTKHLFTKKSEHKTKCVYDMCMTMWSSLNDMNMLVNTRYQYLLFNKMTNTHSSAADMFLSQLHFFFICFVVPLCCAAKVLLWLQEWDSRAAITALQSYWACNIQRHHKPSTIGYKYNKKFPRI